MQRRERCRPVKNTPRARTVIHPNPPGSRRPYSLRLRLGTEERTLTVSDARGIADRIHDLCDRVEVLNGDMQRPNVH